MHREVPGDDCVNICGNYHMVMASAGKTLRVLAKRTLDIEPGDPLEVVDYDGRRLPDARAVSTRELGTITDDELAFLAAQRMHQPFKDGSLKQIWEIVVDRELDLPRGRLLAAANRMGNGFAVVSCDFGFNRRCRPQRSSHRPGLGGVFRLHPRQALRQPRRLLPARGRTCRWLQP